METLKFVLDILDASSSDTIELYGPRHAKTLFSGICRQRRPRSAYASAQSDKGLVCPLTESLDTTDCMNVEHRPK